MEKLKFCFTFIGSDRFNLTDFDYHLNLFRILFAYTNDEQISNNVEKQVSYDSFNKVYLDDKDTVLTKVKVTLMRLSSH